MTGIAALFVALQMASAFAGVDIYPGRPNPSSGGTWIDFELPDRASTSGTPVELGVYDAAGRVVALLADGLYPAGRHRIHWDGKDLAGRAAPLGTYWYRLRAGGEERSRRLVRVR